MHSVVLQTVIINKSLPAYKTFRHTNTISENIHIHTYNVFILSLLPEAIIFLHTL